MGKLKNNQLGFSTIETILVLVVIILIGVVGWLVFIGRHKNTVTNSNVVSSNKTTAQQNSNQYKGWKSYTTKNQKLNFQYPTNWTIADNSSSNGGDDFLTLKSKDGFQMTFQALTPIGAASTDGIRLATDTVKFTGHSDYILYYSSAVSATTSSGKVGSAFLSTSANRIVNPTINTKSGLVWDISWNLPNEIATSAISTNGDFHNAKLVLESATY